MKYKVAWNSPRQGPKSTTVDAINSFAANEQVESMYAHVDGFRIIHTTPVFEKEERRSSSSEYSSSSSDSVGGEPDDFSTIVAGGAVALGIAVILYGMFTLPAGILAMIIGGAIGWLGWKAGCWLSDRGW